MSLDVLVKLNMFDKLPNNQIAIKPYHFVKYIFKILSENIPNLDFPHFLNSP